MKTFYQTDDNGLYQYDIAVAAHPSGTYSAPYGAVSVPPPAVPDGQVARWSTGLPRADANFGTDGTGQWELEADFRGKPLFLTSTGASYQLGETVDGASYDGTGPLPSWVTDQARPTPFHTWQDGAWTLDAAAQLADAKVRKQVDIDTARDAAIVSGFTFDGNTYDSDAKSIQRISAIFALALKDPAYTTPYITADNKVVTLDATAIAGLGEAAAQHESALVFQARTLKDQVLAATSLDQVEAIAWSLPT